MGRLEDELDDYLVSVADDQEVRQGDLIRRFAEPRPEGEWGFVLTADCDIAQGKTGDRYTFIEVVPAQLKRFVDKQAMVAAEQLNGVMKRVGPRARDYCRGITDMARTGDASRNREGIEQGRQIARS